MKITVKITKDVLKRSMMCGIDYIQPSSNCAVALAVIDIFPHALVGTTYILPFAALGECGHDINLPTKASTFVCRFDKLEETPKERLNLPEFSFEIEVPHSVIEKIGIGEAYRVLSESKTLEMVHP